MFIEMLTTLHAEITQANHQHPRPESYPAIEQIFEQPKKIAGDIHHPIVTNGHQEAKGTKSGRSPTDRRVDGLGNELI